MLQILTLAAIIALSYGEIFSANTIILVDDGQLGDVIMEEGMVTEYMNCDVSSNFTGSIGDFETLRRCRFLEVEQQACLIPCKQPVATECRKTGSQNLPITVEFLYTTCLSLKPEDMSASKGLYAKDSSARSDYGGACTKSDWQGDACKNTLGQKCDAPDSECRRYCKENAQERQAYCQLRLQEIKATRTLAVKALKDLINEKKRSNVVQSTKVTRKALSDSLYKRAVKDGEENDEIILLARLLLDDTIDWDN